MKKILVLLAFLLPAVVSLAQDEYKLTKGTMQIAGTSTLHDWTADVTSIQGQASFKTSDGTLSAVHNVKINMDVKSIKSEKGSGMDKNIYKALRAEQYSAMTFVLNSVTPVSGTRMSAQGNLTIAGTTRPVTLAVNLHRSTTGEWVFSGSKILKMTDFNVEPPVVLMGTLKTGNEITVTFEARFAPVSSLSQN